MTEGAVRFMKHYVTNGATKARVHYSAHVLVSNGKHCVTVYAKSYEDGWKLAEMLPEQYENNTDLMTDYFEKGLVRILESDPLYSEALARTVR